MNMIFFVVVVVLDFFFKQRFLQGRVSPLWAVVGMLRSFILCIKLHKTLATKCQWHLQPQMSPKYMKHSPTPVIGSWLRALTL